MPPGYRAKGEQAIVFEVAAWNGNCPQHIPVKIDARDIAPIVADMQARIDALEAENASLTAQRDAYLTGK